MNTTDTGACLLAATATALFSTGHWIGGTVAVVLIFVSRLNV